MRIFLTGATVYIGSSVTTHLIEQRHGNYGLGDESKTDEVKALGIVPFAGNTG